MQVFLTFDVEIWCDEWAHLDRDFSAAFRRYVYGTSKYGNFALPKTLEILNSNGICATFFVEPLFAYRFGVEPLAEIIRIIRASGQDVQLHLHPEWADETQPPLVGANGAKRPLLSQYSLEEQTVLIRKARDMLIQAGAPAPCAFRAGSYGCNRDTMIALSQNGIKFDSSVNPGRGWSGADLPADKRGQRITALEGCIEYPITVYSDVPGRLRQAQVGSTSFSEFVHLLRRARSQDRSAFVIISHNFEMLIPGKSEPDAIVVRRFTQLCEFLAEHRKEFTACTFAEAGEQIDMREPEILRSPPSHVAGRFMEQIYRRAFGRAV